MQEASVVVVGRGGAIEDALGGTLRRQLPSSDVRRLPTIAAATAYCRERSPDCVVAADRLPDGSGLDLLERLRAGGDAVPFVLLAADGDESLAVAALRAGATDYVRPDEGDAIADRVREALDGRHRERQSGSREAAALHAAAAALRDGDGIEAAAEGFAAALRAGFPDPEAVGIEVTAGEWTHRSAPFPAEEPAERVGTDGGRAAVAVAPAGGDDIGDAGRSLVAAAAELLETRLNGSGRLREAEGLPDRLPTLLDDAANPVFVTDDEGRYLLVNAAFERCFGVDAADVVGETPAAVFDGAGGETLADHDREALAADGVRDREETVGVGDCERTVRTVRVPLVDGEGDPDAVYGVMGDAAGPRPPADAGDAPNATEGRDELLDRTTDGIVAIDREGTITYANATAGDLLARDPDAMVGRDVSAALPADDLPWRAAIDAGVVRTAEAYHPPLDVWFEMRVRPTASGAAIHVRDVSERRDAESRLRRYERIVETARDGVVTLDPDGTVTQINEYVVERTGYDRAALVGRDFAEFVPEDDAAALAEALEAVLAGDTGDSAAIEVTVFAADGEEIPVEIRSAPLRDEGGAVEGIVSILRDVSERVSLRREVRERERMFSQFAESIPDVLWLQDLETGGTQFVNPAFEEVWGRPAEEIIGDSEAFMETVHPEDREWVAERQSVLPEPFDIEYRITRPDGEVRWIHDKAIPVTDAGGEPRRVVGIAEDVTESKREERELERREHTMRELYEAISDPGTEFETKVRELMRLGKDVLGMEAAVLSRIDGGEYTVELTEDDTGTFEPGLTFDLADTYCERVVSENQSVSFADAGDDPALSETGAYAELALTCYVGAPVTVDDELHGTFCFFQREPRREPFDDWKVTLVDLMARWISTELERRQAETEIARERDRLEEFASMVSHDLRSPLNVAQGNLDLARESGDPDHLEKAERALDRMGELIEDTLSFARLGARVLERESVAVGPLAREAWSTVASSEAQLEVGAVGTVACDASRLRTLFENLFRNAVEHASDGTAADDGVRVEVGPLADGFYVADDGPGIPPEMRETVFERGQTTGESGTGFGLAIVKQIVDAHGWTVSVAESADGGARFEIEGTDRRPPE